MSVQGGTWNFDGFPADVDLLGKMNQSTAQYGPDSTNVLCKSHVGMFYRAFHTTKESRLERQPYVSRCGNVLTWDGRLDNREELIRQLQDEISRESTDVAIVMAAFEHWGAECFGKLIGDWALALWSYEDRSLILAKDFMGPRQLYYELKSERITWCTHLEPLVLLAGQPFEINAEYIAGYFDFFPAANLTPYLGIDSVSPGTYVQVKNGRATTHIYWTFNPGKKIRYRLDAEYEEHFRAVYRQAVKRRLRSDSPVLSELSGGMDSSSIVCMADAVIAEGDAETPRLDTISYFDDEEPNWDERTYFTLVESKRGRIGCHVDASGFQAFKPLDGDHFLASPGADQNLLESERKRYACMEAQGNRVLLSGIGGDETTGGVPNPIPELADLLFELRLVELARKLKAWSLAKKRPWTHLLVESMGAFGLGRAVQERFRLDAKPLAPWFSDGFARRFSRSLRGLHRRPHSSYPLPSQNLFEATLAGLKNQLACSPPPLMGVYETRYPYLDRDLCDFFFAIPREQKVRPGQRRSLMRRSLSGLVPSEVLQRKRKAYVIRGPLVALGEQWPSLQELFQQPISDRLGFIDAANFSAAARAAIHGDNSHLPPLLRTVAFELWLRSLSGRSVLMKPSKTERVQGAAGTLQARQSPIGTT